MAHLSGTKRWWSTTFVVLVAIFLLVFSFHASPQSSNALGDSSKQTSSRASSRVESIEDLFQGYTDNLSRLSAAYDLIGSVDETKLMNLFEQISDRQYSEEDNAWKSELIALASTRLAVVNLDITVSLFESQPIDNAKYMLYGLMHAWASEDFDGAVEFASKQDSLFHSVALRGIVDASLSLPQVTLLELGTKFGDVTYVERAIAAHELAEDLADPDEAWSKWINDPTVYREENFFRIKHVANALIDKYGVTEADELLHAISNPTLNFKLRKSIASKVALSDPEAAFNFALDTPNDIFGSMLKTVINTWADFDPQSALSRLSLLEPSTVRDRLQHNVISSWVHSDPKSFLASVDNIALDLQDTARVSLIEQLSKDSLEDAKSVLVEITDSAKQESAALTIVSAWLNSDPDAVFQWILFSPETEPYRSRLLSSFLVTLTKKDIEKAFDLAMSQPISGESEVGLEANVIENMKSADIDRALQLLARVRPGATQLAAYKSMSKRLIYRQRTEEALELGKTLSEREQASFYDDLAISIATQEPLANILEIIPNIPTEKAQSEIAETFLMLNSLSSDKEEISDEDEETLLGYVDPGDLERVKFLLRR